MFSHFYVNQLLSADTTMYTMSTFSIFVNKNRKNNNHPLLHFLYDCIVCLDTFSRTTYKDVFYSNKKVIYCVRVLYCKEMHLLGI